MFFSSSNSAGLLVYFDTSVFDPNHGLPEGQESLVLAALRSQGLRLIFDLDCFLEPVLAFRGLTGDVIPKAAQQLERMLKFAIFAESSDPRNGYWPNLSFHTQEAALGLTNFSIGNTGTTSWKEN